MRMEKVAGILGYLVREHLKPIGPLGIGVVRQRLPGPSGGEGEGLFAQVTYPANTAWSETDTPGQWLRPEVVERLSAYQGLPYPIANSILGGHTQLDPALWPRNAPSDGGWPIIVFSSGLRGCVEMYTQFARDLASLGFIVVAVEHEDGSGLYATSRMDGSVIEYKNPDEGQEDDANFRDPFLETRTQELMDTASGLFAVASGSYYQDPSTGGGPTKVIDILAGGNRSEMMLVGHSFGAAGVLRYIRRCGERNVTIPYQGLILSDTWTVSLNDKDMSQTLGKPFFLLMSEAWTKDPLYTRGHRLIFAANEDWLGGSVVVKGTTHQWIAETHYFLPAPLLRLLGIAGQTNLRHAYDATIKVTRWMVQRIIPTCFSEPENENLQQLIDRIGNDLVEQWGPPGWARPVIDWTPGLFPNLREPEVVAE